MATKTELEKLYKSYAGDIYRYAAFRTGNREMAEDVTSETFFRVARQDISQLMTPKAWLVAIARNVSLEMTRKQMLPESAKPKSDEETEFPEWVDETDYEKLSIGESLISMLKDLVSKLDPETREVLSLRVWDELPFGEIAKIRQEKEITVKQRFYRGVEKLRDMADEGGNKLAFTTGMLLSGIRKLMREPEYAYAPNTDLINLIYPHMETNVVPNTAGAPAAAPQLISQKSMTKNVGMFIVAGGLLVTGIVIGANLLGRGIILPNPDQGKDDQQTAADAASETELAPGCALAEYSNPTFTDFKFSYDNCKWEVTEAEKVTTFPASSGVPDAKYYEVTVANKQNAEAAAKLTLLTLGPTGGGRLCLPEDSKLMSDNTIARIARTTNGLAIYEYVTRSTGLNRYAKIQTPSGILCVQDFGYIFRSFRDDLPTNVLAAPYSPITQFYPHEYLQGWLNIETTAQSESALTLVDEFVQDLPLGEQPTLNQILTSERFEYRLQLDPSYTLESTTSSAYLTGSEPWCLWETRYFGEFGNLIPAYINFSEGTPTQCPEPVTDRPVTAIGAIINSADSKGFSCFSYKRGTNNEITSVFCKYIEELPLRTSASAWGGAVTVFKESTTESVVELKADIEKLITMLDVEFNATLDLSRYDNQ
jgi:RNA polymerase sigma-70 factor, ECF subfamily